jgi:prepilin-type N-terminal cleavage/methylation domain-containing protein
MIPSSKYLTSLNGQRSGFTLLELLVVISVMALMMGFIGFSLLGGGGASLDAAQREMVSLVQQTRMQATLSGRETRLIVHDDPTVPEKFHRYLEIVVEDANVTGAWRPLGQGTLLPEGAYIVPNEEGFGVSIEISSNVTWPSEAYTIWSGDAAEDFLLGSIRKGVRTENGPNALNFRYLAFDGEGKVNCSTAPGPAGTSPPPMIVLAIGSPNPPNTGKAIRFDNPNDISGVLLRRYGGFAVLNYDDIAN